MTIEQLRLQLRAQERELQTTGRMVDELTQLLDEERQYTRQLVEKSQAHRKSQSEPAIAPKKEPTKAERVAKMTDDQLIYAMDNPKRMQELFKGL